jgi:hypothetical protein
MAMHPEPLAITLVDLRDYFAGHAMAAIITSIEGPATPDDTAEYAYDIADAMLRARSRNPSSWPTLQGNTNFSKE